MIFKILGSTAPDADGPHHFAMVAEQKPSSVRSQYFGGVRQGQGCMYCRFPFRITSLFWKNPYNSEKSAIAIIELFGNYTNTIAEALSAMVSKNVYGRTDIL